MKNTFLEGRQSGILAFEFPRNTAVEREVRLIDSTDYPSGKIPWYRARDCQKRIVGILLAEGANPAFGLIHLLSFNRRQSVGGRFASRFAVADVGNVLSDADYIVGNVSCVCSCTGCESVSEPDLVADLLQDCKNAGVS